MNKPTECPACGDSVRLTENPETGVFTQTFSCGAVFISYGLGWVPHEKKCRNAFDIAVSLRAQLRAAPLTDAARAVVESGNEAFDNLAINVAQMSLSIDYLYDNLNVLSHLCNGLHTRIEKLESAALPPARAETAQGE